ncbi:basement membrane-specific heparan sulfate proteoglycan core protein-like [Anguilla rostrata]|uniref:basement membrane-specific heparan sulfate proteoglycan core protein-like n=1 Tax=Anguilla rostrata TaxID=7938 RepID=UPI0030CD4CF3
MAVSQIAGPSVTGNRLTIPGAAGSDQGQYWCEGRLEGRNVTSQRSDSINLTVAALPKPTLTVEPKWRPLYNGETITLRCEVDSYSNWTYSWYKDQPQMALSQTAGYSVTGNRLTIRGAAGSDQGQYWCEGRLEGRNVTSQRSDSITVAVLSLMTRLGSPKNVLTLQPNRPLFFTGETVTLRCSGRPFKHYGFTWSRIESNIWVHKHASHDNIYTIAPVTEAHSGVYTCSAESMSDPVRLNVSALPKATLTVQPKWRPLYNGETVTLSCEVDSDSNWIYSWYKDQAQMALSQTAGHSVTGNRLNIPGAAGTDQGQYWCEGRLEGRNVTSQRSNSITVTVLSLMTRLGSPKAVLTLQPNWPLFFTGETVTLTCSGRPFKHYGFVWFRYESDSRLLKHASQDNIYTIAPVTEAHSGVYICEADSTSDPVRLNVSTLPKATLTVEPKWHPLYNGETVTLRCEVDSYSNWTYSWCKDHAQMAVSQTAGHSVTGNRLTIPGAAGSDQGQYWCEGRLEGRNVTSQRSDSINLTVAALPNASLTVQPKWHPLYSGETITLRCEVDSYCNWTYSWYKDQAQMAVSQTAGHSVTGNRLTIPGAAESDQGQYWCEGRLEGRNVTSQRSDSINLTIATLPKASLTVEPKWRLLYNGENVTLRCEVDTYSNWTHFWFRDHNQTATSLSKEYSVNITGAAGSDQGLYWCEGRLEGRNVTSQRSDSITLTVAGSSNEAAIKYTEENVEVDL